MLRNKKTLPIVVILLIVIISGIIVTCIKGMNYGLTYGNNVTLKINLEEQVEIEKIAKEVFGKKCNIKFVNNNKENVLITAKSVSDEQRDMFISKINEKYTLSMTTENFEITNNSKISGKDLIKPYIVPTVITFAIIVIYFIVRYKKIGILEIATTALTVILGIQLLYLSVYAIVRIPVNEFTMPISMLLLVLSFIIVAEMLDKNIILKSNKK